MANVLWVRTQDGSLVNLANCSFVKKDKRSVRREIDDKEMTWEHTVTAYDASEDGSYLIANGLTNEQADDILDRIWTRIDEASSTDVYLIGR